MASLCCWLPLLLTWLWPHGSCCDEFCGWGGDKHKARKYPELHRDALSCAASIHEVSSECGQMGVNGPASPSQTQHYSHFTFPWTLSRVFFVEGGDVRVPEAPSLVARTDKDLHMKPMNISSLMAWAQVMVLTDGRHRD